MYPLNEGQTYPRNQWWVGAMSHEVNRTPMQRTILGEPIVFYRTENGEPVAMFGLCPHRMYPLVKGKLKGDAIECGYHGFTFDCQGNCTRVPSQDSVPKGFRTRIYPTVEKGQWIWVWTGDPKLADPATVPDPFCLFKTGWETTLGSPDTCQARYQLLLDNLFDLSHIAFIHASLVGDGSGIVEETPVMTEFNGIFRLTRDTKDVAYQGFGEMMFGPDGGSHYDTDINSDYYGPCLVMAGGAFRQRPHQSRDGKERYLGSLWFAHVLTPETPTSTHYFGGATRDCRLGDADFSAFNASLFEAVRAQDRDAFDLIEPWIGKFGNTQTELTAYQDGGAIRVRRMLAAQIAAEQLGVTLG